MATVRKKKVVRQPTQNIFSAIKEFFFSSQGFPILLTLSVLGVLFVLFRMKGIELDYKINEVEAGIAKVEQEGKELNARKAKLLSSKNLRTLAKKHKLKQPKSKQIIVIP